MRAAGVGLHGWNALEIDVKLRSCVEEAMVKVIKVSDRGIECERSGSSGITVMSVTVRRKS